MNTLIENKQLLADIRAELRAAEEEGARIAATKTTQLGDLKAASDKIDDLAIREALLVKDIEAQEGKAPKAVENKKNSAFSNFAEFANAVKNAAVHPYAADSRLASVSNSATGMNETTNADGGYLVPPEYAEGVVDLVKTQSILYPQARKVTIASNRLIENYINETSRVDPTTGSRHGGVLAYWKAEAAQMTAVKAAIGQRTTNAEKLTAYCPVTEELLQDAPALESMLDSLVAKEFAFKVDDAILNGTGSTANMPAGILSANALVTIAKESGQTAGTVNFTNIVKMYNALIGQCRAGAKWYINQDVEMQLIQMLQNTGSVASTGSSAVENITGTFGMPVYQFPGQYGNENGLLMGKPVIPVEQCAALGTKGDIILADMSQYLIVERTGVTRQASMHIRFDFDETVFKFTWRLGGRPDWESAITPYKGTTARSPYVALATRA